MKTYELTYIISPEISAEEAESTAKDIESLIQGNEGVILKQENPVAKALSYPIKKRASGFVASIEFQVEPEKLAELQTKLQKDEKIVRHIVIIKQIQKIKKQRRSKLAEATATAEQPKADEAVKPEETATTKEEKPKVELKDIEQKLDEILGE